VPIGKGFFGKIVPDLTKHGGCGFFPLLQPKSGFLPEARCGGPNILKLA
jgi:hypothetical protein